MIAEKDRQKADDLLKLATGKRLLSTDEKARKREKDMEQKQKGPVETDAEMRARISEQQERKEARASIFGSMLAAIQGGARNNLKEARVAERPKLESLLDEVETTAKQVGKLRKDFNSQAAQDDFDVARIRVLFQAQERALGKGDQASAGMLAKSIARVRKQASKKVRDAMDSVGAAAGDSQFGSESILLAKAQSKEQNRKARAAAPGTSDEVMVSPMSKAERQQKNQDSFADVAAPVRNISQFGPESLQLARAQGKAKVKKAAADAARRAGAARGETPEPEAEAKASDVHWERVGHDHYEKQPRKAAEVSGPQSPQKMAPQGSTGGTYNPVVSDGGKVSWKIVHATTIAASPTRDRPPLNADVPVVPFNVGSLSGSSSSTFFNGSGASTPVLSSPNSEPTGVSSLASSSGESSPASLSPRASGSETGAQTGFSAAGLVDTIFSTSSKSSASTAVSSSTSSDGVVGEKLSQDGVEVGSVASMSLSSSSSSSAS